MEIVFLIIQNELKNEEGEKEDYSEDDMDDKYYKDDQYEEDVENKLHQLVLVNIYHG